MKNGLQINLLVLRVASVLLAERKAGSWCYALARRLKLSRATIADVLARLEIAGWLKSDWERLDTEMAGRPRRKMYRITDKGASATRAALAELTET